MKVIFGGTFDPVHVGHLRMANELAETLSVKAVSLMPCYEAVHKQKVGASSEHRLNMLALAIKTIPCWLWMTVSVDVEKQVIRLIRCLN